jgi:hypothetical protein
LFVLQIGTAVAVIAITAVNLGNVQSLQDVLKLNQKFCLASADPKNMSVCTYIYAVGAVSIVLTILIGLLQVSSSSSTASSNSRLGGTASRRVVIASSLCSAYTALRKADVASR